MEAAERPEEPEAAALASPSLLPDSPKVPWQNILVDDARAPLQPPEAEAPKHLSKRRREIEGILAHVHDKLMEVALAHSSANGLVKGMHAWREPGRLRALAKRAALALVHRNMRKGCNGWKHMIAERTRKLNALRQAGASFLNRALRKGINGWQLMVRAKKAALDNLSGAARSWVNRAMAAAWRKLAALVIARQKAKRAAASFLNRNLKKGINGWTPSAYADCRTPFINGPGGVL